MNGLMCRLDNLCIEIIGKNINKLSRIPKENWSLRFFDCLGEKIIISSLSNSNEKLDEKSYEFIFANFNIKKFRIKFNENENIKYYNFLNNKNLEYLEIHLNDVIKINENEQNFGLTVNKLRLHYNFNYYDFTENYEFFSKLKVRKKLKIYEPEEPYRGFEKLSFIIMKNTSIEIERMFIVVYHLTDIYVRNCMEEIKERKNLKQLIIDSKENDCHLLSVNLMQTIFLNYDSMMLVKKYFSDYSFIKNSDCPVESFKGIENLTVLEYMCWNKTKKMFELINKLNLTKIKKLSVSLKRGDYFKKFSLFERCSNTEHLELSFKNIFEFSLNPFTETLKILELNYMTFDKKTQCANFFKFISNSTFLTEICFNGVEIHEYDFFESFELFKNTLTSFTFSFGKSHNENEILLCLSKTIKKFKKLEIFSLDAKELTLEISENICESLLSSSKSLRKLKILDYSERKNIENCSNFFELLKNCEKLDHIHINFLFEKNRLIELFSILNKFKNILRYIKCEFNVERKIPKEYLELLSECCRLEYIDTGYMVQFDEDITGNPEDYLKNSKYTLWYANGFHVKRFYGMSPSFVWSSSF